MLGEIEKLGLIVDVILLDRGFHTLEVVLLLKNQGVPFVMILLKKFSVFVGGVVRLRGEGLVFGN
ncbi:MAG: hypothetical protein KIH08_15410, partial [Candidatus Freyarchaeota archaeon]|nr:hypothetical protein [Candidatus Jordarchaeia archaeon]